MDVGAPDPHLRISEGPRTFGPRTWLEEQRRLTARAALPPYIPNAVEICCPAAAALAGAVLGCLATLYLSALGVQPAIASAAASFALCALPLLTGTANLLPSVFFSAIYGGSFGGMTPIAVLMDSVAPSGLSVGSSFVAFALFCGVAFCAAAVIDLRMRGLVRDYGGRLGGLAAIASFLFLAVASRLGADGEPIPVARMEVFDNDPGAAALTFAMCLAGMLATLFALRQSPVASARRADRILVSAIVALIGLALLHHDRPDEEFLLDAFYAGCFLGMSSPKLLKGPFQVLIAALILTAILLQSSTMLPAVGGSLGAAAFVAVVGLEIAGRLLGAVARTILGDGSGHAVLVRAPIVPLARPAVSYGSNGWKGGRSAVPANVASRSIPVLAIGIAASLAVAAVLVPSRLPLEQPVETTGSITTVEAPGPARAGWTAAPPVDAGQPLTSPGMLILGTGTAGTAEAGRTLDASSPAASPASRHPSSNVQIWAPSTQPGLVPRRAARALPAVQPALQPALPPAKRHRTRRAIQAATPATVQEEAQPVWEPPTSRFVSPER